MSSTATHERDVFWKLGLNGYIRFLILASVLAYLFHEGIYLTVREWFGPEYSHGLLIPFISGFLIWQKKNELANFPFTGSWLGFFFLLLAIGLFFLGELATLYIIIQYSLVLVVLGLAWSIVGTTIFKKISVPLLFLFFGIPLPIFIFRNLSSQLQLWSSEIGVFFIRLFDISVYLEGNVIDLGSMQLQVVEACSGLRYLFPLVSLAFMLAYFYKVPLWKRAIVCLSSIPITILMNSFRIGMIGVMVEFWGKSMAEGFLHDFEGWVVFMVCTGLLVAEMWLLNRLGNDPRPLSDVFGLTMPEPVLASTKFIGREFPRQFWAAGLLLIVAIGLSSSLEHRQEIMPQRAEYIDFPMQLGDWKGQRQAMEQQYVDQLKFDDYILVDYSKSRQELPVNLYSAYYASQRKGESIHSPRSCIPGGGWRITSLETVQVDGISFEGRALHVNRAVIQKDESRQILYYWFPQRGRDITNEFLAKWFLFWDALTINRTDGALVRLTTPSPQGEDLELSEQRLKEFLRVASPDLERFLPK